jgi:GntR family transcriptional regulator
MSQAWKEDQPIYRQIRDRVLAAILDGGLLEGAALPSVRQVAADFQVNPLTVSKAYQELADEGLVERRRGVGMFIVEGAREALARRERDIFLKEEWPALLERIRRLGLDPDQLLRQSSGKGREQ